MNSFVILVAIGAVASTALLLVRLHTFRRVLGELAEFSEAGARPLFPIPERLIQKYHLGRILKGQERLRTSATEARATADYRETIFRNLLPLMEEALLLLDNGHRIVFANQAAHVLFGIEPAPGQRVERYLRSVSFLEFFTRIRSGTGPLSDEVQLQRSNGVGWCRVQACRIEGLRPESDPHYLFVINNITKLKSLETVRRDFIADVSHELRTPLTIIRGFSESLSNDYAKLSEEQRLQFLQRIRRNVERLHALVEDLLSLSRLEAGYTALRFESANLSELVGDILRDYQERFPLDPKMLQLNLTSEDVPVRVDRVQIEQVLVNLIDNALRYAETHTYIRISVSADRDRQCGILQVEDDGVGIPRQDLARIFQRFYRVDKGRSRERGGTGLGLSIVKHVIQLHGGTTEAFSYPGRGLRVQCLIPLRLAVGEDEPETSPPSGLAFST